MMNPRSGSIRSISSPWAGLRRRRLLPASGLIMIDEREEKDEPSSIVRNLQITDSDNSSTELPTETTPPSELQPCNEAKCLSTGLYTGGMFNCYGQGPNTLFPFICADNFVGLEVLSEDVATPDNPNLKYYTCCPPSDIKPHVPISQQYHQPQRHCEDPHPMGKAYDPDISSTCASKSSSYPYGRKMTYISGIPDAYMCCNSNDADDTLYNGMLGGTGYAADSPMPDNMITDDAPPSIMDQIEPDDPVVCYSAFWCSSQNCTVTNSFFNLQRMNCANDVYHIPKLVEVTGNTGSYECCSTVEHNLLTTPRRRLSLDNTTTSTTLTNNGSFLMNTTAFNATIGTQFVIALIASFISLTLIVAISVSLYKMKKKPKPRRRAGRANAPDYSSYNLYLVFLCIPDLIYNIFTMVVVMQKEYDGWIPASDALITVCATINMYMNCIIAHEVMVLLRRTKNIQRYTPPTYKKASLQFLVVTIYAITLGLLWFFLIHSDSFFGTKEDDSENALSSSSSRDAVAIPWRQYSIPIFYVLIVAIPLVYLVYVCFTIWKQELFPKGQVTVPVIPRPRIIITGTSTGTGTGISRLTNPLSKSTRTLQQTIDGLFSRSRTTSTSDNNNNNNNDSDNNNNNDNDTDNPTTTTTTMTTTSGATNSTKTKKDDSNGHSQPIHDESTTKNSTTVAVATGDDDSGSSNNNNNNNNNNNDNVVATIATISNKNNDDDATPQTHLNSNSTTKNTMLPSFNNYNNNRPPPTSSNTTTPMTVTAATTTTTTTTSSVVGGRLNILVMYFMRIILVFFFVWLPGMIMYYRAYETDRTSAGLLQNIGFLFFTLQAIVSGSMVSTHKKNISKEMND